MTVPPQDLPRVAWQRILRELRTRMAPRKPREIKVGSSTREIASQIRSRQAPRFFGLFPEQAALIAQFFPDAAQVTIHQADMALEHHFDLLGSGDTDLGKEIDWHRDFINGHSWPKDVHHSRLQLVSSSGGFDVKVPWELSRFHHAIRLGQAYLYTLDEKYAREIIAQVTDWIKNNPYEFGVNWAGPMDVAIRVVNWIWAYYFIIESQELSDDFLALWLNSIRQHGEFLLKHMEDGWPRTNHLLANLTGLAYLGIMFPEFPDAVRWKSVGLGRLWSELERQVYADGMDYEASVSYHRLVTEMVLSVAGLCVVNDIAVPDTARARLESMLNVIMAYTQPNGFSPQIGDADDGRLHILTAHKNPDRVVNDHRHLLALGSIVLERELSEWAGYINPRQRGWAIAAGDEWQDAFWCFASDAAARFTDVLTQTVQRPDSGSLQDWVDVRPGVRLRAKALAARPITASDVLRSRGFEASGLYTMYSSDCHAVIDAGGVGQDGAGGHAHNDTLSFSISAYGRNFLIDPGSYVYTSKPLERNSFRSTVRHNVLQVGSAEINRIPENMFRLGNDARVTIHQWISQEKFDLFDASHNGYARLKPGVFHRRQLWFNKTDGLWILHDRVQPINEKTSTDENNSSQIDNSREIDITLWFHFAPIQLRLDRTNNAVSTEAAVGANLVMLPMGDFPLTAELVPGWYAPRYGIKQKTTVAKFTGRVKLPIDLIILIYPYIDQADLASVRAAGRAALTTMRSMLLPSMESKG